MTGPMTLAEVPNPLAITETWADGAVLPEVIHGSVIRIPFFVMRRSRPQMQIMVAIPADAFMRWLHNVGVRRMQIDAHTNLRDLHS